MTRLLRPDAIDIARAYARREAAREVVLRRVRELERELGADPCREIRHKLEEARHLADLLLTAAQEETP